MQSRWYTTNWLQIPYLIIFCMIPLVLYWQMGQYEILMDSAGIGASKSMTNAFPKDLYEGNDPDIQKQLEALRKHLDEEYRTNKALEDKDKETELTVKDWVGIFGTCNGIVFGWVQFFNSRRKKELRSQNELV